MGRQGPLDWVADWNSAHADAATLAPAAEVPGAEPMATLFEAIPAVRHALPGEISVYAAFAGPGLLHRQLRDALRDGSRGAWDDSDFVAQAVLAAVRQSFEVKADGVALLEQTVPTLPAELLRVHKKVRKMADFYNAGFLVFDSAVAEPSAAALPAHCSFAIGAGPPRIERVTGRLGAGLEGYNAPVTTAGDVPADSPVAAVQSLMRPQTGTQSTQGPQAGIADLA